MNLTGKQGDKKITCGKKQEIKAAAGTLRIEAMKFCINDLI